jgi:hypothetical protein
MSGPGISFDESMCVEEKFGYIIIATKTYIDYVDGIQYEADSEQLFFIGTTLEEAIEKYKMALSDEDIKRIVEKDHNQGFSLIEIKDVIRGNIKPELVEFVEEKTRPFYLKRLEETKAI